MSAWQIVTVATVVMAAASVAISYLVVRRFAARLRATAQADLRARERQALEINDNIVQGLARVKWALEARQEEEALTAADETLAEAQRMVTDLLMAQDREGGDLTVARLRRDVPAGPAVLSE